MRRSLAGRILHSPRILYLGAPWPAGEKDCKKLVFDNIFDDFAFENSHRHTRDHKNPRFLPQFFDSPNVKKLGDIFSKKSAFLAFLHVKREKTIRQRCSAEPNARRKVRPAKMLAKSCRCTNRWLLCTPKFWRKKRGFRSTA